MGTFEHRAGSDRGNPWLSVIIPCYESQQYFQALVDSLIAGQSDESVGVELIFVNDGSKAFHDFYCRWCSENGIAYPHPQSHSQDRYRGFEFVYLWQSNKGPATARNKGLSLAKGEFVAFFDSDDSVKPEWLKILRTAIKIPSDITIFQFFVSKDQEASPAIDFRENAIDIKDTRIVPFDAFLRFCTSSLDKGFFAGASKEKWAGPYRFLFKRSFIMANDLVFPTEIRYMEDNLFLGMALLRNPSIRELPIGYYVYNCRNQGISQSFFEKNDCKSNLDFIKTFLRLKQDSLMAWRAKGFLIAPSMMTGYIYHIVMSMLPFLNKTAVNELRVILSQKSLLGVLSNIDTGIEGISLVRRFAVALFKKRHLAALKFMLKIKAFVRGGRKN